MRMLNGFLFHCRSFLVLVAAVVAWPGFCYQTLCSFFRFSGQSRVPCGLRTLNLCCNFFVAGAGCDNIWLLMKSIDCGNVLIVLLWAQTQRSKVFNSLVKVARSPLLWHIKWSVLVTVGFSGNHLNTSQFPQHIKIACRGPKSRKMNIGWQWQTLFRPNRYQLQIRTIWLICQYRCRKRVDSAIPIILILDSTYDGFEWPIIWPAQRHHSP